MKGIKTKPDRKERSERSFLSSKEHHLHVQIITARSEHIMNKVPRNENHWTRLTLGQAVLEGVAFLHWVLPGSVRNFQTQAPP